MSFLGKLSRSLGLMTLVAFVPIVSFVAQPVWASQPNPSKTLPTTFVKAVLQDASQRLGLPLSQLSVKVVENQTWSNGCLGLSSPGMFCTQALVPGHRVTVEGGRKRLVYRTNAIGSVVKLEKEGSTWSPRAGLGPVILPNNR